MTVFTSRQEFAWECLLKISVVLLIIMIVASYTVWFGLF